MARQYTTQEEVENYLLVDVDPSFASQITSWIEQVSRYIEQTTNRVFVADEEASERFFDGNGGNELRIDECIEIDTVERGNDYYGDSRTEIPSSGSGSYIPLPNNYEALNLPIQSLLYRGGCWNKGIQNHAVTAKWGFSATPPEDIMFAATVFVAGIINSQRKDEGEVKSETIGNYSVTYEKQSQWDDFERAQSILLTYKRYIL